MTEASLIRLIKNNLTVTGDEADTIAREGFNAGMSAVAKLPSAPWNKDATTFELTSGTKVYTIGDDILDGEYADCRGIVEMWHTDTERTPIHLRNVGQFNKYARGSSETGRPFVATMHGKERKLEFYYTPDSDYTVWAYVRFALKFEDIPDEDNEIIAWAGLMAIAPANSGGYRKGKELFERCRKELENESYLKWEGSRYIPEMIVGNDSDSGKKADSGNRWGLV